MIFSLLQITNEKLRELTTSDYAILIIVQILFLAMFIYMVSYICRVLKKNEPKKNLKKTCILVWFMSAIAWFIVAQIIWIITYVQLTGG